MAIAAQPVLSELGAVSMGWADIDCAAAHVEAGGARRHGSRLPGAIRCGEAENLDRQRGVAPALIG
jgi:hypothetical protein